MGLFRVSLGFFPYGFHLSAVLCSLSVIILSTGPKHVRPFFLVVVFSLSLLRVVSPIDSSGVFIFRRHLFSKEFGLFSITRVRLQLSDPCISTEITFILKDLHFH